MGKTQPMNGAFQSDSPKDYQKVLTVKDYSTSFSTLRTQSKQCGRYLILRFYGKIVVVLGPIFSDFLGVLHNLK